MSVTIDIHQDFFWRETNDSAYPVAGIAPPALIGASNGSPPRLASHLLC
jgi:hypothetical protein